MSEPRQALEAVQYLATQYRQAAEALDACAQALTELVETGEFTEQRRQAMELARPHLSPEALQRLGLAPSGHPAPPRPKRPRGRDQFVGRQAPGFDEF